MPYADPHSSTARAHALARQQRYRTTPKGKNAVDRYNVSAKGRARGARYEGTLKRGIVRSRYIRKQDLQQARAALEAVK